ncbi:hypothetical protein BVY03_00275, partial [bacterium K02(2017)]
MGVNPDWTGTHRFEDYDIRINKDGKNAILSVSNMSSSQTFMFPRTGGTISIKNDFSTKIDEFLNTNEVFIGNASNLIESVSLSGDATLDSTGSFTIVKDAVVSMMLQNEGVLAIDISTDAVGRDEIITDAVRVDEIKFDSVGTSELILGINADWTGTHRFLNNSIKITDSADDAIIAVTQMNADQTYKLNAIGGTIARKLDYSTKMDEFLNDADIFIGNNSNLAVSVAVGGDATIDSSGALTIIKDAVISRKILNETIIAQDIATNAVDVDEIITDAVRVDEIKVDSVGDSELIWGVSPDWTGTHRYINKQIKITDGSEDVILAVTNMNSSQTFVFPLTGGTIAIAADYSITLDEILPDTYLFLGNSSAIATGVLLSGDATIN